MADLYERWSHRYLLATVHMSLALVRLVQGFIKFRDTIGPVLYFANISVRLNMAKDYIYITNVRPAVIFAV